MSSIVLSGIRATSRLHLGNFIGAILNFVKFQQQGHTCLYFIADFHTLTTLQNPKDLRDNLLEIVKDYLAAGLDPEKSTIYAQSSVPEIPELSLLLSMKQMLPELLRLPTLKDLLPKKAKGDESSPDQEDQVKKHCTLGMISYPVLMAADILGPKATLVPVGADQRPNVELARSIARKFNLLYGETFPVPEMMDSMVKVPGLDGGKMSKSQSNSAVDINAPIEEIRTQYLKKGVTDVNRKRRDDPGNPYDCVSIFPVHEVVSSVKDSEEIAAQCAQAKISCVECKNILVDRLAKIIQPYQNRRKELASKDEYIKEILHEGGKRARKMFTETLSEVRDKMGIVIY